ncbi:winged helix-turn-helix transcriptional regulator [bacterium]|nr:winged helix-turn-helix transcriptional regulator [bacterium]MBQ9149674.1 winged helix-turn-helix transcriptional regulator [bacterium]
MKINKDDIKRLRKAFYGIHSQIVTISKEIGYKSNLLWFLYALDSDELKSQKQICDEWHMTKTTLNTLVKECEVLGYVKLKHIKGEKREKHILLTELGKKYMINALDKLYSIEEKALLNMNNHNDFINNLESFYNNLQLSYKDNCKENIT